MSAAAVLYRGLRPALFCIDAERAHRLVLARLDVAHRLGLTRLLRPALEDDPVDAMGLRFPNPVGLAAGLDKDAAHADALGALGFGFVELGTVTPRPQPGNPRPRLFRLVASHALINRFGFNSEGLEAFVERVRTIGFAGVVGLNLGKNATTPNERALEDYVAGLRAVHPLLAGRPGYVAINLSSPNTRDLRALQRKDELAGLLRGLACCAASPTSGHASPTGPAAASRSRSRSHRTSTTTRCARSPTRWWLTASMR
jgi:dihydroorotate dehydrogenase